MKSWPIKPLGGICELVNGAPFKPSDWDGSGLPIVRIQNLNDATKPFNYTSKKLADKFRVRSGDTLLSWSGTPGTSFGCFRWDGPEGWLNQHIFNVHLGDEVLPPFFIYQVNSKLEELIAKAHGGVGLQHITKGALSSVNLIVPPLAEQKRIANLLDEADALRKLRNLADRRMADLIPALFYEMFSDMPATDFPMVRLGDVAKVKSGAGFPINRQGLLDQEVPFFKVGDMNTLGNESEMHVFRHSISEATREDLSATLMPAGSVIFPKVGAAIATNKKRVLVRPSCVDNNVMAICPGDKVLTKFILALLVAKNLTDFASNSNPPSIRKTTVEDWKIPFPPLPLQKKFAARVSEIRAVQSEQAASRYRLESVRRDHTGLHSFLNISLMEARRRNASAFRLRFSQSLASRLHRPSHANVRSTTHRFGNTIKPLARSERLTISTFTRATTFFTARRNTGP